MINQHLDSDPIKVTDTTAVWDGSRGSLIRIARMP